IPEATPTDHPNAIVEDIPEEVLDDLTAPVVTPNGGMPLVIDQPQQLSLSYASALRPTGTAKLLDRRKSRGLWFALMIIAIVFGVVVALAVH
ncbi:MAG TPA: hypothetical protein VF403_07620, partial [Kofleriaceae bacterium]